MKCWQTKHAKRSSFERGQVPKHKKSKSSKLKLLLCIKFVKVFIRAVFSRTASLNMTATFKLFIINSPNGPIIILYSDKALMERQIGANGTLGPKQQHQG